MWLPSPRWAKALEWVTREGSSAGLSRLVQPRPNGSTGYSFFFFFSFFLFFPFLRGHKGKRRGEESLSVPWFPHLCIQGLGGPHTGSLRG